MVSLGGDLEEETREWVEDGVISESQREEILERYGDEGGRAVSVILALGALMVGLGALLFVAANWRRIPVYLRLLLLTGVTAGALGGGWHLKYRTERERLGAAVVFMGSMLVGASIFLVAQMFHVPANSETLLLLWLVAVAPVAYSAESRATLLLCLVLLPWWSAGYVSGGDAGASAVAGLLLNLPGYLFYGLALVGVGFLHEERGFEEFGSHYRSFGLGFVFLTFYALLVTELRPAPAVFEGAFELVFLAVGFGVTAASLTYVYRVDSDLGFVERWYAGASGVAVFVVAAVWLVEVVDTGVVVSLLLLLAHVGFFGLTAAKVYVGYRDGVMAYINLGLVFFVLYVGYLYVRLLAGYLGGSLAFVVGGAALLAGGSFLERKRREVREEMDSGAEDGDGDGA